MSIHEAFDKCSVLINYGYHKIPDEWRSTRKFLMSFYESSFVQVLRRNKAICMSLNLRKTHAFHKRFIVKVF